MALSEARARTHVEAWCAKLSRFATKANWPKYVFHAAHVVTAVDILQSGLVRSRASQGEIRYDVANQAALGNNPYAHPYARMYFRPRNDFHLRTEGTKHETDRYWAACQMSIPIILAFDAISVLTLPGVEFSKGNLSKSRIEVGQDEPFFDSIPFEFVYHDEAPHDLALMGTIHYHRMAEVIVPGQLPVVPHLRRIICRTQFEKATLLHLLGPHREQWQGIVTREQIPASSYFRREIYVLQLELIDTTLLLSLKPPHNTPTRNSYRVTIHQMTSQAEVVVQLSQEVPIQRAPYAFAGFQQIDGAIWTITIEGMLTYCGEIPQGELAVT